MKKLSILFLFAAASILSSCSKDDDNNTGGGGTTPVTNTSKLCNKDWKIVSIVSGGVDLTSFLPACQLDNLTRFLTDGTLNNDEGATKCDPNDPQTTPGTWAWAANETKLIVDTDTTTVVTNNGTTLKLSADDGQGGTYEITFGL